jgi:death-on-curing family protein
MPRSNRRIFHLARLSGKSEPEVIAIVRAQGIDVRSANDLVSEKSLDRLDAILGIERWSFPGIPLLIKSCEPDIKLEIVQPLPPQPKPRLPKWPTVGHPTNDMVFITADEVEQIHWTLVNDFQRSKDPIDPPGLKSKDLLESAVYRTRTSLGLESKYPTVPMAAAALLHAIISNHAFHNGNKRTALVATLVFLHFNGMLLEANEDELFDYLLRVAAHEIAIDVADGLADQEMLEIARWMHRRCRPVSNAEKPLKFREFRSILMRYGCTFDHGRKGNRINITRTGRTTQVYYRNEGSDVERNTIRKVRQELGLTDVQGYDSSIFYDAADRVPEFIHKYRRTLDRLAKV